MAGKGKKCPACGKATFHTNDGDKVLTCSQCKHEGWSSNAPPSLGGLGQLCHSCGKGTLHTMRSWKFSMSSKTVTLKYCTGCRATLVKMEKISN